MLSNITADGLDPREPFGWARKARRTLWFTPTLLLVLASPVLAVRVAIVRSFVGDPQGLPAIQELNNHWADYGDIRVDIDRTLQDVDGFTYQDLVDTGADVIWLSNPAGSFEEFSASEIAAIQQYVEEGHHLLGTFRVFRFDVIDNRELAPLFGLPQTTYNSASVTASQTFELLEPDDPLFVDVSSPYVSMGFNRAQVPNSDASWDDGNFGTAKLLARTFDHRGVITFFKTETYHAVYISEFVEFVDDPAGTDDVQFLYNVVTLDATPTGECCGPTGACEVVEEPDCASGEWTQGGSCDPNPCPQLGACCSKGCFISFEADCNVPGERWTEGIDCETDSDTDFVIDACDLCLGFDDFVDSDFDGTPNGCDLCPAFDDRQDADKDGAPDGCDECPDFDDQADTDGDGVPDGCDICPGFNDDLDCDDDTVPDGCDSEPNCNGNSTPDNCDIELGTSEDCDGNDVPDECQPEDADGDRIIDPCDECFGDDALIGDPCDSPQDADDCRTGQFECSSGTLTCSDGPTVDGVDSDEDGVFDCNDLCPGTPPGSVVDANGCRPSGACCFVQDICHNDVPFEDCEGIGGHVLGLGLTCGGDPDLDGVVGCLDDCPLDGAKSQPGQCGCGRPDTDSDNDDTADCADGCPNDPNKTEPGLCGCEVSDDDTDGDGTIDCRDGCPTDGNKTEPGVCGCNVPDADSDDDGAFDCEDDCPANPDKTTPGVCGCDVPDVDSDHDGTLDCGDECSLDPEKVTPGQCGCGVIEDSTDTDNDGVIACLDDCANSPAGVPVDEDGCSLQGGCCFPTGGGVCLPNAQFAACTIIGGRYQGNGSLCAEGCAHPHDGDINSDGQVDISDLPHLTECLTGPGGAYPKLNCDTYDFDSDFDVDAKDVAAFQNAVGQ